MRKIESKGERAVWRLWVFFFLGTTQGYQHGKKCVLLRSYPLATTQAAAEERYSSGDWCEGTSPNCLHLGYFSLTR